MYSDLEIETIWDEEFPYSKSFKFLRYHTISSQTVELILKAFCISVQKTQRDNGHICAHTRTHKHVYAHVNGRRLFFHYTLLFFFYKPRG